MADHVLLLAVGLSVGLLLLLLGLMVYCVWRRTKGQNQNQYQELLSSGPAGSAPLVPVSQGSGSMPSHVPFAVPPRFIARKREDRAAAGVEEVRMGVRTEARRDALAHRGSLSVGSWYPVGTVLAGLYSAPLSQVVAPPPGLATRLCFSVEYRHSGEQLTVSLLRLANLPPRFHGNITLVELRRLPDDRRPRQAKARGTGPDPEFSDCFIFQVSGVCVHRSTVAVCVLSVEPDGKRHVVGRVLFPLEGALGQAGRLLWKDLEPEDHAQCSEVGDVLISLSYSPVLQRVSVGVLRARGLQLLTGTGVCVQVSLQIHTQAVKVKRSSVVRAETNLRFDHRTSFKLRPQHLDEACVKFELQQNRVHAEAPLLVGVLVLGPFMYARGPQLQHWMDMVNAPEPVELWHGLSRTS